MNIIKLYWGESIPGNYTGIVELLSGENNNLCERRWYKEGKLHREDGPAIENSNGDKKWFKDGKYHRIDGPAVEYDNGTKEWHKEGKIHREDGPAVEYANGYGFWYVDDEYYGGNITIEDLLRTSIFLSVNENGKYNIPWLSFLTEQGVKDVPILPNYPYSLKYIYTFVSSLPVSVRLIMKQTVGATIP